MILGFSATVLVAVPLSWFARALLRSHRIASNGYYHKEKRRVLESFLHLLRSLYNPDGLKELIRWGGAPLVCGIVFIETGFFVGFFLPGDSLLITAGVFAATGRLHVGELMLLVPLCAIE